MLEFLVKKCYENELVEKSYIIDIALNHMLEEIITILIRKKEIDLAGKKEQESLITMIYSVRVRLIHLFLKNGYNIKQNSHQALITILNNKFYIIDIISNPVDKENFKQIIHMILSFYSEGIDEPIEIIKYYEFYWAIKVIYGLEQKNIYDELDRYDKILYDIIINYYNDPFYESLKMKIHYFLQDQFLFILTQMYDEAFIDTIDTNLKRYLQISKKLHSDGRAILINRTLGYGRNSIKNMDDIKQMRECIQYLII